MSKRKNSGADQKLPKSKRQAVVDYEPAKKIASLSTQYKDLENYWHLVDVTGDITKALGDLRKVTKEIVTDVTGDYREPLDRARKEYRQNLEWAKAGVDLCSQTYEPGGTGDGDLVVAFMAVGNGDCIFVKTPGGNVIVVDCGSRARPKVESGTGMGSGSGTGTGSGTEAEPAYRKCIRDYLKQYFLKPDPAKTKPELPKTKPEPAKEKPSLYALILTHPDMDHCNELVPILEPEIGSIKHLFHSGVLDDYDAKVLFQGKTAMKTTKQFLLSAAKRRSVSINSLEVTL